MKLYPDSQIIAKHVDHYWLIRDTTEAFINYKRLFAYPGIRPEIILLLKGHMKYTYQGVQVQTPHHFLASHIDNRFLFDVSELQSFLIIQFKPKSLAALLPFMDIRGDQLIKKSVCDAQDVFGTNINQLAKKVHQVDNDYVVPLLDEWLLSRIAEDKTGLVSDVVDCMSEGDGYAGDFHYLKNPIPYIQKKMKCSTSTLERYFRKEMGMTPKKYFILNRYKAAVEEIYDSQNDDWIYYVEKYGYHDQSHMIKEIKRYTHFTPEQLLGTPGLRSYRPV